VLLGARGVSATRTSSGHGASPARQVVMKERDRGFHAILGADLLADGGGAGAHTSVCHGAGDRICPECLTVRMTGATC
jgi:hypothetical protein